ncbi:MAG: hypothetical protein HC915_01890 [Anaerolineae bacterium]|nr:hypothetical protein [Anaerolineae bacterium]
MGAITGNTTTLTILETGNDTLTGTLALSGPNANRFEIVSPGANFSVQNGDTDGEQVIIRCLNDTPTTTPLTATLTVTHNGDPTRNATGGNSPVTYGLSCSVQAAQPTLDVSTNTLTFERVANSSTPQELTFQVQNTNPLSGALSWSLTDTATWLACNPSSGSVTGAQGSQTVTCAATATGITTSPPAATITVTQTGGQGGPETITATLNIVQPNPGYASSPVAPGLDSVLRINTTLNATTGNRATLQISETGTTTLQVTSISIEALPGDANSNPSKFTRVQPAPTTPPPVIVIQDGGAAQEVIISCDTSVAGTFRARLNITWQGATGPVVAPYLLECVVTTAAPLYTSTPAAGGTLTISTSLNATNNTTTLTVDNTGNADLAVSAATFTGTDAAKFSFNPAFATFTLSPDAAPQALTIRCDASATGTFTSTLTITHNGAGSPATYTVTCTVSATPPALPSSNVVQCPANQVYSQPLPQNANGEFLLLNCFLITGPGR